MTRPWRSAAVTCLAACLLLVGCTTLPTSGDVHRRPTAVESGNPAVSFAPPGPGDGDPPLAIAKGFLLAMQANPLSTSVARSFLTTAAKSSWKPNQGTIVYEFSTFSQSGSTVTARLADAHRLDSRGGWLGGEAGQATLLPLHLVREHGQWRIANPANALVVPASYFQSRFVPFNLYFYDQSGRVLVPEQIYVPRGEQSATNLVRGLLAGPGGRLADVVRSAFPLRTNLDLSVGVSDSGVAEVPLSSDVLKLTPDELHRVFVQLAWTLGQVPGINRVRITVDQAPVPLPDGRSDVTVSEGREYDPEALAAGNPLLVDHGGRLQEYVSGSFKPVAGPFGRPGFSLRSFSQDVSGRLVAAVAANHRTVYVGPLAGSAAPSRVHTVYTGTDVLRPSYDMFGNLWLVDRTPSGAKVVLVAGGRARTVPVRGLSGRSVTAFSVARDGTRLVAAFASRGNPSLAITDLVRSDTGVLRTATPARPLPVLTPDLGPALDVAWESGTTLAVLSRPAKGRAQVSDLQVDGSPGDLTPSTTDVFRGEASQIVAPPSSAQRLYLIDTRDRMYGLSTAGSWARVPLTDVAAASYG
jgi:hypothetical protein